MRDTTGPQSVRQALLYDQTLGGIADGLFVGRPSALQGYDPNPVGGGFQRFGQEWRVGVMVSDQ